MEKVEVTEQYIRIPNPKFSGSCEEIKTITISADDGIKALYCVDKKKVKTYLFDTKKWELEEAKQWVKQNAKNIEFSHTTAELVKTEKGLIAIASDASEDRDGEEISIDGWDIKSYKENPVLLWMHNRNPAHDGRPIGVANKIGFKTIDGKKRLVFEPEFDDTTQFNRELKAMVERLGLPKTFSVGFIPKERDENVITKQELLEISMVPIPSNRNAMFVERAKGFGIDEETSQKFVEIKTIVPYRAYDPAPESRAWDASNAIKRVREYAGGPDKGDIDFGEYKNAFTWYDGSDEKNLGVYKLPHHDVQGGKMITVWRGVAAAMAALLGARGGISIPETDRKRVYDHLAKHYEQFDKTPPDYKLVETQELKSLFAVHNEMIREKAFKDFKKSSSYIKRFVSETIEQRKKEQKDKLTQDSKLIVSSILKGVDKHIAKSLKDGTSLGKEEK